MIFGKDEAKVKGVTVLDEKKTIPAKKTESPESNQEIKTQNFMLRLGGLCIFMSLILFIAQTIIIATTWRPNVSSIVTGFCLSFFLLSISVIINSVYGSHKINWNIMAKNAKESSLNCLKGAYHLIKVNSHIRKNSWSLVCS